MSETREGRGRGEITFPQSFDRQSVPIPASPCYAGTHLDGKSIDSGTCDLPVNCAYPLSFRFATKDERE